MTTQTTNNDNPLFISIESYPRLIAVAWTVSDLDRFSYAREYFHDLQVLGGDVPVFDATGACLLLVYDVVGGAE